MPQNIFHSKIEEALLLAGDTVKKVNIEVNVRGGGMNGQAEAVRLAIAKALAVFDKKLHTQYLEYDRVFTVADVRRKETHKPNCQGKARAKRQKSYR
ncbi:30S ribosomal protein S9 [uncultured archaeon]|nr:30S ribosomal protein S9 [uncultured archaeon]